MKKYVVYRERKNFKNYFVFGTLNAQGKINPIIQFDTQKELEHFLEDYDYEEIRFDTVLEKER